MPTTEQRYDVVTIGEMLIDLIATEPSVSLFDAPAYIPQPGGAPANVAVGARRLGARTAIISKVGADDFGRGLRGLLAAEGVSTAALRDDPELPTTLAFVALDPQGEPHFTFAPGAHTTLRLAEIDPALARQTRIAHGGSVALAHEPSRATNLAWLAHAKAAGAIISYDVNWRPQLWRDATTGLAMAREPLALVDICKLNAAELRLLTGCADMDMALAALETTAALIVVTEGAAGCRYRLNGAYGQVAGFPVARVVDSVGAGDAFMAALLAGIPDHPAMLTPNALAPILARANRAAALSVSRRGAIPSLPYAHEL